MQILRRRYLTSGETPDALYRRVARTIASVERSHYAKSDAETSAIEDQFYGILSSRRFCPGGRTLANNVERGDTIVANCVVLHPQDSLQSIMQTLSDAAMSQKFGSGIGFTFGLLRPAGAETKTVRGSSSGPISFLHAYNTIFSTVRQQSRNGAFCL
jgi:ribonucleoside-diphosphate reductase alpha chain